ncbi:cryptochrome/photolyase family protein [Parahaliea mediterranea]|uniref:Deoxyribodipyrimidine photo-lyase n=1 Tax=Parahaliea mediterranea TaxID=651086 RepID=A0A939DIE1_9GAMM|nr:deoxyribodipyrimidine photo-lyase [Parahaliea mediterranea]MBN7798416.1 deoxyribodipyrimidine photo-lyase [Parahaliea mediterranea]
MSSPIIFWFRQDLRLRDHPGLSAAAATGRPLLPVYILDEDTPGHWRPGGASRWWLHYSLEALDTALRQCGARLLLRRGPALEVLRELCAESGAEALYCTRQYEPWAAQLERALYDDLGARGVEVKRFPGNLLFEPGSVLNQSGEPFKVFTPFWRHCLRQPEPPLPRPAPEALAGHRHSLATEKLGDWRLVPHKPDWASNWHQHWRPGPEGAGDRLQAFLANGVSDYDTGRNHPARECTSRLSPHLHYGEISPRMVWHAAQRAGREHPALADEVAKFLSELGWREFAHHLLHFFPNLPESPFKAQFDAFPWRWDEGALHAWQRGRTGYPVVDAGMRELWQTGYMHNRVRMVTASFLTKHLLLHWRHGEDWFWDTLVDADLANNASGWQWVAGSGADAAPYFRIFNPVTQGEKFDAGGDYVRRWVPELAALPDKYLHQPFAAPAPVLAGAGVVLGETYPQPIVDHREARQAALAAYEVARN